MPDWLTERAVGEGPISTQALAARLVLALVFGGVVAAIYRFSHGRNKADAPMMGTTLVLLAVLIAMVTLVIGDSVARAFSLVGALSIVRFRTVVNDTRDTAFVIFAVIVGMAAGTGLIMVPVIGAPVVALAAAVLNRRGNGQAVVGESSLTVRVGLGLDPEVLLTESFARHLDQRRLLSVATARQGAAIELIYSVRLKSDAAMTALVAELNQIEGVVSVDLRRL